MTFPNYITLFRILLVPFFFTSLVSYEPGAEHHRLSALSIFLLACFTDALDGFIARVFKLHSQLGRFLDPLADKLLLLSGYLGLLFVKALPYHPPLWITVTVVFRDLVILGGLIVLFLINGQVEIKPNFLGKCTTVFQMLTLMTLLLTLNISIPLAYLTAFFTIASCLSYVIRDLKKVREAS